MQDRAERFFVWVWRLNGLLILGLALAGTALAVVIAFNIGVFASEKRPDQQLSEVAGAKLGADELRLGDFRAIEGDAAALRPARVAFRVHRLGLERTGLRPRSQPALLRHGFEEGPLVASNQ